MNHRLQRVKELIRRELGPVIERDFTFGGALVTINDIDLTPDLKQCFVYLGVLGKGDGEVKIMDKLTAARSHIQRKLYKRVVLKNSPTLFFRTDNSVERGVRIVNLIDNLPPPAEEPATEKDDGTKSDMTA